jgi:hypothetical protein
MLDFSSIAALLRRDLGRYLLLGGLLAAAPQLACAQTGSVGIGTTAPDVSAALDIVSSTKGALLPRVADATTIATPATGLLVFQTSGTPGFYYNAGTPAAPQWQRLTTGAGSAGDNLGNHTATQDVNLQGNALTGTGADLGFVVGVGVRADGGLNLGQNNTSNIYLGYQAGNVSTGFNNLFGGIQAGLNNTTGFNNVYLGYLSGRSSTTGINNVFGGNQSGSGNTTGSNNVFSGFRSGSFNTTGSNNTALGYNSGPANGSGAITNATALGANVALTTSNTVVLGNNANVGIGTSSPGQKLEVAGQVHSSTGGFRFPDNSVQATAASAGNFIQNQTSTDQTGGFRISGNGLVGGNLGVGTVSPVSRLSFGSTVQANMPAGRLALYEDATLNFYGLGLVQNPTGSYGLGVWGGTSGAPYNGTTGVLPHLYLDRNSINVGIGTLSATQKLEVAGQVYSSTGGFRFPDNTVQTTAAAATTASNGLTKTTNDIALGGTLTQATTLATGGFNLAVTGAGNVGIGTSSPSEKLDVRGTTITTNAFIVNALTGYGADIGGAVGLGVRPDGGLNIGQNTTGHNVFLGYQSGRSNLTGSGNQFGGYQSGYSNTTGSNNLFSGSESGYSNTTGSGNQFSGYQSGRSNTTGGYNLFSGAESGYSNTTGSGNLFSGHQSGRSNTTGIGNQFFGYQSGYSNTTGNFNQFSGYQSGYYTTGDNNVFSGNSSGYANTTGSNNTFVGTYSGDYNTTGSNNTGLGYGSGPVDGAIENATAVGANVSLVTSNTVVLGNGADVGIGTNNPAAGLHIDRPESGNTTDLGILLGGGSIGNPGIELRGLRKNPYIDLSETIGVDYSARLLSYNGTLHLYATNPTVLTVVGHAVVTGNLNVMGGLRVNGVNYPSDRRFKTNVRPLSSALASVLALRGVRYDWNALGVQHGGTAGAPQVGLIAQELEQLYPELVSTDADGYKAVNYAQLAPVLIEALKEQQVQIEALKGEAATANTRAASAETKAAQATATLETFEARLRRLEASTGGQARK